MVNETNKKQVREGWEDKIPYIVKIKEDSEVLSGTTCHNKFCGYLVNFTGGNFYFKLNGCRMMVIVNHNDIEWMAPSAIHFNKVKKNLTND